MSDLAINKFQDDFATIDVGLTITRACVIKAIKVKMLKHGTIADGSLNLEVFDGARSLGSKTITAADFNTISATYAWGYIAFEFDESITMNIVDGGASVALTLRFTMSGHTEDNNNYVALIRQFENEFVSEFGSRPSAVSNEEDGWYNPYGIEIVSIQR